MLSRTSDALCESYDVALLDLDGVVYIGRDAVDGAANAIQGARAAGMRCAFVTNNAARPPAEVAEHLVDLGVPCEPADVVTSAQAAVGLVAQRFAVGTAIVCLGTAGLRQALEEAGFVPVGVEDDAVAIVSGYGPDLRWRDVMRAAVRIREGLPWVATNADLTIPTPYGVAPGHGVLVDMLSRHARVEPPVAGKPSPPLLESAMARTASSRPLMIGDRLDTDIAGAHNVGIDSLLVLTGVTGLEELVAARADERPSYVAPGLGALVRPQPPVELDGATARCGGWRAEVVNDHLGVHGSGDVADWWRAVAGAGWAHLDATGEPVDTAGLHPPR